MKRALLTIIVALFTMTLNAQEFHAWEHTGTYHESQCYNILEMSDGNFAVKEGVFDEYNQDLGYILYKITPEGELVDSLFLEPNDIISSYPMLRDPYNDNSNIMISFCTDVVNGIEKKFYKATYFNDNLEITGTVVSEYPDKQGFPQRLIIDSNNDIIGRTELEDGRFCLFKMNLDGEISAVSEAMSSENAVCGRPIFQLSANPLSYGYVYDSGANRIKVMIFDSELNKIREKVFVINIGGWLARCAHYTNVCGTGDGHFVLSVELKKLSGTQLIHALGLVLFNGDLEREAEYTWGEYIQYSGIDPEANYFVNNNLVAAPEGIYVVWNPMKYVDGVRTNSIAVTYFDRHLNLGWERQTLTDEGYGMFVNFGITLTDGGGLALSGWNAPYKDYYLSKTIYAIMLDNIFWSANEVSADNTPFRCYPNPAGNVINLNFAEEVECQSVEIFTLDGRLVETFPETSLQTSSQPTIDISSLNAGVYILKVKTADGKEYSERIVKE